MFEFEKNVYYLAGVLQDIAGWVVPSCPTG